MVGKHEICVMQVLLVSATETEISAFDNNMPNLDIMISGVGVPSTMYHLQKRLQQITYDIVIQAGIAGTFNKNITGQSSVIVRSDIFADLGIEEKEFFTPIFETGFANENDPPFTDGWLVNQHPILQNTAWPVVKAITVNKVSDSNLQNHQFSKLYTPDIETMEGAALHYVCLMENIPFLQIRSISNLVGERDKSKWRMKDAIVQLGADLSKLFAELQDQ